MDINHPFHPLNPLNSIDFDGEGQKIDYSILDFLSIYGVIILFAILIVVVIYFYKKSK